MTQGGTRGHFVLLSEFLAHAGLDSTLKVKELPGCRTEECRIGTRYVRIEDDATLCVMRNMSTGGNGSRRPLFVLIPSTDDCGELERTIATGTNLAGMENSIPRLVSREEIAALWSPSPTPGSEFPPPFPRPPRSPLLPPSQESVEVPASEDPRRLDGRSRTSGRLPRKPHEHVARSPNGRVSIKRFLRDSISRTVSLHHP